MHRLLALISFISRGEFWLVGALFAGYVAAFICCWSLTNRMGHAAFDLQKAIRQLRSPFIHMGSLFLILGGVAQFFCACSFTAAGGYFLFMLLALGCLLADRCHGGEKN